MGKKRHLAFEKRALNIRRGLRPHPQTLSSPPPGGDRLRWQGREFAILVRNDIKFEIIVSLTRAPLQILILKPSQFS